ncbi:MAG: DUF4932 domain-containing protein [Saprospiraceae bacterium]
MKQIFFLSFFLLFSIILTAQNLEPEIIYPGFLQSKGDTFFVNSQKFRNIWSFPITRKDTLNLGTSGYKGVTFTIYTDIDTLEIPYVNFPNRQLVKIPIVSAKDTALCILRFQSSTSNFSDAYADEKKGKVDFQIPEVYELANVILYLSECSKKTGNRPETDYGNTVQEYFSTFKNHKLIQVLNENCKEGNGFNIYYGFRENSICFELDKDNFLQYQTPYRNVMWDATETNGGYFRNMLYLVQDFANKSNFRKFYNENTAFYASLIERQKALLPVKNMWSWMEKEFPNKMDAYKIIFSPLIGGSHSTQRFQKGFFMEPEFEECIMFINSPERIDKNENYSEDLKEALMSGIVFTEIDHNYVNQATDKHIQAVKSLMSDKDKWASKQAQENYQSEYAIFNEYMTHALFCLYLKETYNSNITKEAIQDRIDLMNRRGYPKFEEFNEILLKVAQNRTKTIFEIYPEIIGELKKISGK